MISDDTEHAIMVAQSLLDHPNDVAAFTRALAWRMRWWFLGLPAGVGLATARACLKLWLGFPASKSGVYSAGNGPAMRSAIIGAFFADNQERLVEYVRASTVMTHTDPKALVGALAVAHMAAWSVNNGSNSDVSAILKQLQNLGADSEWIGTLEKISLSFAQKVSVEDFGGQFGSMGVSGYMYHTVPVAIYAWLVNQKDFHKGLTSVLNCGGDTDTIGAITGALLGATTGPQGIPTEWISGIGDQPRSVALLRKIASQLALQKATRNPVGHVSYAWPLIIPRNMFFLLVVLSHGVLRLLR